MRWNFRDLNSYDRRMLGGLIAVYEHEIPDHRNGDANATRYIIKLLEAQAQLERKRGVTNRWTYNVVRHEAIIDALKLERKILAIQEGTEKAHCGIA